MSNLYATVMMAANHGFGLRCLIPASPKRPHRSHLFVSCRSSNPATQSAVNAVATRKLALLPRCWRNLSFAKTVWLAVFLGQPG